MITKNKNRQKSENTISPLLMMCILIGVLLIFLVFFQWDIIDFITPVLFIPLLIFLLAIFGLLIIGSVVNVFFQIKKNYKKGLLPLFANIIILLILWVVSISNAGLEIKFRIHSRGYAEVIEMIETGELVPDHNGIIQLPSKYKYLSKGGEITVDQTNGVISVFFCVFRGVLDNTAGFIYRSNDTSPVEQGKSILYLNCSQLDIKRIDTNWYYCVSH